MRDNVAKEHKIKKNLGVKKEPLNSLALAVKLTAPQKKQCPPITLHLSWVKEQNW